jgi:hypothetical protein
MEQTKTWLFFLQNEREVTREAGEKLARDLNAVFLETCAKDNLCVNDLFQVQLPCFLSTHTGTHLNENTSLLYVRSE